MKRRGFLKLLGLLPFAPALAAAATIKPKFINPLPEALALTGSDQTSIWLCDYSRPSLLDFAKQCGAKDWQLPVIEALSQKNPFTQDMAWQEKNIQLGNKVNWDTKWLDLAEHI